jgi:tRNA-2-methylthio-N6-dimethylallyladenosine synthase
VRRYHVTTFGCQMNAHDSERIKGMLEELGLGEAPSREEADVVVFNTCTIREAGNEGADGRRKRSSPPLQG